MQAHRPPHELRGSPTDRRRRLHATMGARLRLGAWADAVGGGTMPVVAVGCAPKCWGAPARTCVMNWIRLDTDEAERPDPVGSISQQSSTVDSEETSWPNSAFLDSSGSLSSACRRIKAGICDWADSNATKHSCDVAMCTHRWDIFFDQPLITNRKNGTTRLLNPQRCGGVAIV